MRSNQACFLPLFAHILHSNIGDFACYKGGDIVCNQIKLNKEWDPFALNALMPYMTPNTTLIDVGSNVGWYAFLAAHRNFNVVAFEPFSKNIELQNSTRCLQPKLASRITVYPFGLSSRTIHCSLHQNPKVNFGDTHTACDDKSKARFEKKGYPKLGESVMHRLDDVATYTLRKATDNVMKVDIEGHEYEMMLGARDFVCGSSAPKAIFIEVFQLAHKKRMLVDMLTNCGYSLLTMNINDANYLFRKN